MLKYPHPPTYFIQRRQMELHDGVEKTKSYNTSGQWPWLVDYLRYARWPKPSLDRLVWSRQHLWQHAAVRICSLDFTLDFTLFFRRADLRFLQELVMISWQYSFCCYMWQLIYLVSVTRDWKWALSGIHCMSWNVISIGLGPWSMSMLHLMQQQWWL